MGLMVGTFVLWQHPRGAVKSNLRPKTDNLPRQMTIFNTVIPILVHFFTFLPFKVNYFAPSVSAFGIVKPNISQSQAAFHNDVGFATVYCRIPVANF